MADLKSLKLRITGIKKTAKITKAMQMVAASKLRRARENAENSRAYSDSLAEIISREAKQDESTKGRSLLYGVENPKNALVILATTDRGLCGGLNVSVAKEAISYIKKLEREDISVKILTVGKKGADYISSSYGKKILERREGYSSRKVSYQSAKELTDFIVELFVKEEIDFCKLVYPKFKNAMTQEATVSSVIPADLREVEVDSDIEYEYEPERAELLEKIVPQNIAVQLFQSFLELFASEQGARMSAMDNAVNNCKELVKKLNLQYNRSRQAKITTELIEIIAASESI